MFQESRPSPADPEEARKRALAGTVMQTEVFANLVVQLRRLEGGRPPEHRSSSEIKAERAFLAAIAEFTNEHPDMRPENLIIALNSAQKVIESYLQLTSHQRAQYGIGPFVTAFADALEVAARAPLPES